MLALLLLMGCPPATDDTSATDCFAEAPYVEVAGVGETVVMVHGPQGGWHVDAQALVHHMSANVALRFTVHDLDTDVRVSENTFYVALRTEGCVGTYADLRGILGVSELVDGEADTPPELLVGHTLELALSVEDEDGRTAMASVRSVAQADPADVD